MIRSGFRPSDDACTFSFNIPVNAMVVVELQQTASVLRALSLVGEPGFEDAKGLAVRCDSLASQIEAGIRKFGIVDRADLGGEVYAYEVDGFGNAAFMDDANIPSLLSLPWLGYTSTDDPIYARTRKYLLSPRTNPWFFSGSAGEGVGGPHTGPYRIWPMAITMRALTSTRDDEITEALKALKASAAVPGSWLMHESFNRDDAGDFTRPWFAWANSLFGELVMKLSRERPHLVGMQP